MTFDDAIRRSLGQRARQRRRDVRLSCRQVAEIVYVSA